MSIRWKARKAFYGLLVWMLDQANLKQGFKWHLLDSEVSEERQIIFEIMEERKGYDLVEVTEFLRIYCNRKETCDKDKSLCGALCDYEHKLFYSKDHH